MRLYRNVFFPYLIFDLTTSEDKCPHNLFKTLLSMKVPILVGEDKCQKCPWNAGSVRVSRIFKGEEMEFEYIKCTHEVI